MFGGLEGGGGPLFVFAVGAVVVEVDLGASRGERDEASDADLGGFAHDGIHGGAFGERLGKGDGGGAGGGGAAGNDVEDGGAFGRAGEGSKPLAAVAVESDDGIADAGTVDVDEVVRLGRVKGELAGGRGADERVVNTVIGHRKRTQKRPPPSVEGRKQ